MNDSAYEFFEILHHKITDVSGDSQEVSFLFQRLSVIIQRFKTIKTKLVKAVGIATGPDRHAK